MLIRCSELQEARLSFGFRIFLIYLTYNHASFLNDNYSTGMSLIDFFRRVNGSMLCSVQDILNILIIKNVFFPS
jgi:hypothetical protein